VALTNSLSLSGPQFLWRGQSLYLETWEEGKGEKGEEQQGWGLKTKGPGKGASQPGGWGRGQSRPVGPEPAATEQ
jgi:hypothetical protein